MNTQLSCTSSGPTAVIAQSQKLAIQSTPLRFTLLSLEAQEKRGLDIAWHADFLNQMHTFSQSLDKSLDGFIFFGLDIIHRAIPVVTSTSVHF